MRRFERLALHAAAIALALFANAFTPVNNDLGWILAFGRDAVEGGALPRVNTRSFTAPGHPVVMTEWASSVLMYALHARWGAAGLIVLKWLLIAVSTAGIVELCRRWASPLVALLTALVATHHMWMGFELVRAQLFTLAFLPWLTVAGLTANRLALWACVPLAGAWANFHGGFLAGWTLLTGLCAALLVEQRRGWAEVHLRPWELVAIPVAAALATFANPYGARLQALSISQLLDPDTKLVAEWLPLWRLAQDFSWPRYALVALGASAAVAAFFAPRRALRLHALVAFAVATSLLASRHVRLAPVLLAAPVAVALDEWLGRKVGPLAHLGRAAPYIAAVAALGFGGTFALRAGLALRFVDYGVPSPARAIGVMLANDLHGKVWNEYDWGGFLTWAAPASRIACDGSYTTSYPRQVVRDALLFGEREDPLAVVERYGADMALLKRSSPAVHRLASRFAVLYCDEDACLLSSRPEHASKAKSGLKPSGRLIRSSDLLDAAGGPSP